MAKKKKSKATAIAENGSAPPAFTYKFNFTATGEQIQALMKEPALVVKVKLDKPLLWQGVTYRWFVHPVRFTPEGKPENLGPQIFCRDEAEANREEERLLAHFKAFEAERQRAEAERPIPGTTIHKCFVVGCRTLNMSGTLLTSLRSRPKCCE